MQIQFPPELLQIEKWKAFKGDYPPGSAIPHRIIVAHKHDGSIRYFYVTSQIEKCRKMTIYDKGSLVDGIFPDDWDTITEESCIQCNKKNLYPISESDIRQAYADGKLEILGDVPEKIISSIISAICASKSFTDTEKKILTV